jgi:hypothetical protein
VSVMRTVETDCAHDSNANLNPTALHNLTYILILHPIAGFVALLAFVFGLLGVMAASRFCTIMMSIMAFFAAVLTLVVFVIDMVLWNLVMKRIETAGGNATLVSWRRGVCGVELTSRATLIGSPLLRLALLCCPSVPLFAVLADALRAGVLLVKRLVAVASTG